MFNPDSQWHVLHVKPRQEKALAKDLMKLRITGFLPLVRKIRTYGKRTVWRALPLFPGYVFLQGMPPDVYRAYETNRIVRVLPVADQQRLARELDQIRRALSEGICLEPHSFLTKGQRAVISAGPLCGLEGVILDTGAARNRVASDKFVLQVDMLGTAACMEIDGSLLQPLT